MDGRMCDLELVISGVPRLVDESVDGICEAIGFNGNNTIQANIDAKMGLCVTDIGFSTPARVYFNDNFTKKNFEIYRLTRQLKADGKIYKYYTSTARVSVTLDPDSRQIGIDSVKQLNSLIENFFNNNQNSNRVK